MYLTCITNITKYYQHYIFYLLKNYRWYINFGELMSKDFLHVIKINFTKSKKWVG